VPPVGHRDDVASNLPDREIALRYYRLRMWIEEMFGDLKKHGFDLESTMLHDFLRLSRLTLAVAFLYVWLISVGGRTIHFGLRHLVDRNDRRDLSIFQIGLRYTQRRLTNAKSIITIYTMQSLPPVSVIIVTWNSKKYLPVCLEHLLAQTLHDFEVILVDNGSEDGTLDGLHEKYLSLNLQIHRLSSNRGFAAANNIGASLARGQWLALLNADAFPHSDWLEQLLKAVDDNSEFSFFASRQLQANKPELLDGAGDAYHVSGLAWRQYFGYPADQFGLVSREVFSACAAAALYSRDAFLSVGGFDEDFFSYYEDVDLSFRLRLQGSRCLYVPDAVVKHVGSASAGARSDFSLYHWQRNLIWSFVQNMPSALMWRALPLHILANIIFQIHFILRGHGAVLWKAKVDALRGLSLALRKRRKIQSEIKIDAYDLLSKMEHGFLQPYLLNYNIRKRLRLE
jgi:GT2 family glycosyltransferase